MWRAPEISIVVTWPEAEFFGTAEVAVGWPEERDEEEKDVEDGAKRDTPLRPIVTMSDEELLSIEALLTTVITDWASSSASAASFMFGAAAAAASLMFGVAVAVCWAAREEDPDAEDVVGGGGVSGFIAPEVQLVMAV